MPQLSKENLELGLTSILNLIDIFSGLKNEFGEIAHKGFFLVYELYSHYTLIYKANIKNDNISRSLNPTLTLINQKINNLIESVNSNSDEKILKISNDLKFDEEGTPIYKKKERLYVK
ncbi:MULTISPECIES: BlyB family putative holin accessory protein [Borreliella]|uniref:BlyB family putative holin accessory protein n=1 Tax=Borreliella TaxID=64895 RepID=UPI001606AAF6